MDKLLVSALSLTLVFSLSACTAAPAIREPIVMRNYSPDAYTASNLLVARQVRMALPEGWRFKAASPEEKEMKDVRFFIKDTGSNTVTGALRYTGFDHPVPVSRLAPLYAEKAMSEFSNKEIAKTEIDGEESYVVQGTWTDQKQRASALIQQGPKGISDITLIADPGYFTRDPSTAYTIFNSYQFMPRGISERRIKGAFSFKCDNGSMEWFNDTDGTWDTNGFVVSGRLAGEFVVLGITEVKTSRFSDFFKLERLSIKEFETEVHIAGMSFPARGIGNESSEKKLVSMHYLFKHGGKSYRMHVYRTTELSTVVEAQKLHEEPEIRRALDAYFYFAS
jgi:hypothetical protein